MSSERRPHRFEKGEWKTSPTMERGRDEGGKLYGLGNLPVPSVPIFAPCATHIDLTNGVLRGATVSEVFKCCNERCAPKIEYCMNMCEKHLDDIYAHDIASINLTRREILERCKSNCRTLGNMCSQECRALSPGFNLDNHYYKCAVENGCKPGLGQIPDKSCIEKKKDVIFNCCRSNCLPTSITNCQDLCLTLQDAVLNPEKLGIPKDMYERVRESQKGDSVAEEVLDAEIVAGPSNLILFPALGSEKQQPKSTHLYLVAAVIVALFIAFLIIGIIWWRRHRKNK